MIRFKRIGPAVLAALVLAASACGNFGFSNRVLWRVPAPGAKLVAVCQEIPEFDGPSFDVRLERPDQSLVAHIWHGGDSQPCSEMAWSPDGRILAILTGHVATVTILNVEWALAHLDRVPPTPWWQFSFSTERDVRRGEHLRFASAGEIAFDTCPYRLHENGNRCFEPAVTRQFAVEPPLESTIRR